MRRSRTLVGLAAIGAVVVGVWLLRGRASETGSRGPSEQTAIGAVREQPRPVGDGEEGSVVAPAARESVTAGKARLLAGRVATEAGAPIPGALVTWIAVEGADIELTPSWPMAGWGVPDRRAFEVTSDETGSFSFEVQPGGLPFGSALVALHPAHFAGGLDLPAEAEEWPNSLEITLEPARPIAVEVVDARGKSLAGAVVRHVGQPGVAVGANAPTPRHEHFLQQTVHSDGHGRASLAPFRGEQALWAEKDGLVSAPWQGRRPTRCRLVVGEAFTLGGSLTLPDWTDWDPVYRGERRILVSGLTGNLWRPLARMRDVREGSWGPLRVPLLGVSRYRVRLEGAPIVPLEESFLPPAAGAHLNFDSETTKESHLWFMAVDEEEQPILTARVRVTWGPTALDVGPRHAEGAPRPDGTIFVGTFPAGRVRYRVSAPGYATAEGAVQVPHQGIRVGLAKGGRIVGRCMRAGRPVSDFEIVYSKGGIARLHRQEFCLGREDGGFVLESLQPGDWSISAATPECPSGAPVTVHVTAEETSEVVLEIGEALSGGGRIVSAESGEAIPDARVQAYSSGGLQRTFPWGSDVPVAADGTFEMAAFVPGKNYITVEADGHASARVSRNIPPGQDFLDWGDIRLFRPQALEISLLGMEQARVDPTSLRAYTIAGHQLPERPFDQSGKVRFEGVPPGDHELYIAPADNTWSRLHLRLEANEQWSYDFKSSGIRKVTLRILDDRHKPMPGTQTLLTAQEDTGVFVVRFGLSDEEGVVHFEGVRASSAQVLITDSNGEVLATRDLALSNTPLDSTIVVGDAPLRVHVVGRDGKPISDAWVRARSPDGERFVTMDQSDAQGWAEIFGLTGAGILDVDHGIAGIRFGIPVPAGLDELEITLEAEASLELRVLDGEHPLGAVGTRIETRSGISLTQTRTTDRDGRVRYEPLGEGEYRIICRREGAWTISLEANLAADEQATRTVQMRRLADLELTLLNRDGLPMSNLDVELRSLEFGVAVATWTESGRAAAPAGLRTDVHGILHIEGLPRGAYRWSVAAGEQLPAGSIELEPGKNTLSVRVQ